MDKPSKHKKTFFFSDIEGSTRMAQQLGEAYASVLERHRTVIRMALNKFNGREIDTSGDGFFIVFENAVQAVHAARSIQQAFAAKPWAREAGLKVRIGIHSGKGLATDTGYTGLEVHRASRICNVGHGGQVLISKKVMDKVKDELPEDVTLLDLGSYQLKDFDQPDHIYQLVIPETEQEFPPLRIGFSRPNVAVLPFTNLSEDPEQDYFCEGISEEIILALDNTPGLGVVSRSTSFALKGKNLDIREVGRMLGATAVLEGRVRKKGNQLRISVELVDTNTGTNIWSDRFDRKLENVFELQDEIARNIVRALEVKLVPEREHDIQNRQTRNIEAYDYYLKGRHFYYQFSLSAVKQALQMFQQAIAIDEEYALAYCGLADCYSYLYMYDKNSEENLKEANLASLQAMELAPMLAEAHSSRGVALSMRKQYKKAEMAFERAIELNPSLFDAWYQFGRVCFSQGKMDKAARLFEEATRHRPDDYQSVLLAAQAYDNLGIKKLATKARERGIAIAEKRLEHNPSDLRALYLGANALMATGQTQRGLDWIRQAMTLEPEDPMLLYNAGCAAIQLGMPEEAIYYLEQSYAKGLKRREWYENDGNLDPVREHPRFRALMERMGG